MMRGGYREGAGRSKTGWYKGIYCGSTYELCWAIYNIDHGISFRRFEGFIQGENLKYYPDFLIGNSHIVEIKGYENVEAVNAKTALAISKGYTIDVLYKDDIKHMFDYVRTTYKTSKFQELYDNYKPAFEYTCSKCARQFQTDKKRKTDYVFCSRSCAGKATAPRPKSLQSIESGSYKRELSKEEALAIYFDNSSSLANIAKKYNTTKNMVWFIKSKRYYRWIHADG